MDNDPEYSGAFEIGCKMRHLFLITTMFLIFATTASAQKSIGYPFGIPLENGALPIVWQDQHSDIVDLHLTRLIDEIVLTQNTSLDDTTVYVSCDTLPVAGNTVCFKESYAFYQGQILTVTPTGGTNYTLVLDTPLDYAYTTAGVFSLRDDNLNVNGSVTPVIFFISPSGLVDPNNPNIPQKWDIVRIMLSVTDDSAMDDAKFGGITGGITNGVVIRQKDGHYKNIFNAKNNGDFALHAYDVTYIPNTLGPSGEYGLRVRRTWGGPEKNGAVLRLDASTNDEVQLIVRDNLTALTGFYAAVQGHIVEMALPIALVGYEIPKNTWVKVASGIKSGTVHINENYYISTNAYIIVKNAGDDAPTAYPSESASGAIAVESMTVPFSNPTAVDIYIWSYKYDISVIVEGF